MVLVIGNLIDGDRALTARAQQARQAIAPVPRGNPVREDRIAQPVQRIPVKPAAPARAPAPAVPRAASSGGGGGASSGGGGGGGGGGAAGIKESTDAGQVKALEELLKTGFAKARDIRLGNIQRITGQQQDALLRAYDERAGTLKDQELDNEMAEADASFANVSNRIREARDLLQQAAAQGLGETDTLQSQLMAIRNWDANQAEVNRAYFDTQRSVANSLRELSTDTRTARINLATEALGDQEQVWANYYNQRADAATQLGNIKANPYSDQHDEKSTAYEQVTEASSSAWKNPGVDKSLQNWEGNVRANQATLNNTQLHSAQRQQAIRRPEGSTLRRW